MMPVRLLAVGSTLVDIQVKVRSVDVQDAGLSLGNSHLVDAERMSSLLDRRSLSHVTLGGSTANTVRGFTGLGGAVDFVTAIGEDGFGELAQRQLADCEGYCLDSPVE